MKVFQMLCLCEAPSSLKMLALFFLLHRVGTLEPSYVPVLISYFVSNLQANSFGGTASHHTSFIITFVQVNIISYWWFQWPPNLPSCFHIYLLEPLLHRAARIISCIGPARSFPSSKPSHGSHLTQDKTQGLRVASGSALSGTYSSPALISSHCPNHTAFSSCCLSLPNPRNLTHFHPNFCTWCFFNPIPHGLLSYLFHIHVQMLPLTRWSG